MMVAVLIAVLVALLGAWATLLVALAVAKPDSATMADAIRVLPDTIRLVQHFSDFLTKMILVVAVVLLGAAGLLILNTIRMAMYARRREICLLYTSPSPRDS